MLSGVSPCAICQTSVALVHVERGDAAVGRLDERQPLDREAAAAFAAAAAAAAASGRRRAAAARRRAAPRPAARRAAARPRRSTAAAGLGARSDRARCPGSSRSPTVRRRLHQPERRRLRVREDVEHLRFGIERAALPVRAARRRRAASASRAGLGHLLTTGGVKIGPIL